MSTGFWIANVSVYVVLCIFQLIILLYLCDKVNKDVGDQGLAPWTRNTGYGVLLTGFLLFLSMLCAYTIPLFIPHLENDDYYCDIEFRIRTFLLLSYELWLFFHWFGRIMYSFDGSMFALTKGDKKIGLIIISLIGIGFMVSLPFLQIDPISYNIMKISNDNEITFVCTSKGHTVAWQIYIISLQLTIILLNITFSIIFMKKLRAIYLYFGASRLSSAGDGRTLQKILVLVRKYVILTLCSMLSTVIAWIFYLIIPLILSNNDDEQSLYYNHFLILINIDIFINSICVILMFKIAENYYEKCLKCKPCGNLCTLLVDWIEKTQFPQKVKEAVRNVGQRIKYVVNLDNDNNKNGNNSKNHKPRSKAPTLPLPSLPDQSHDVSYAGSVGSADIKTQLKTISFEKPKSLMVESDPDMGAELNMALSSDSGGNQRQIQQVSLR